MATVEILTTNFSGETAQITFTPCSGGTINLGSQVLPYDYVSDNYEGSYSLYFPDFTQTCTFNIPCSDLPPTPTPTVTGTPEVTATPTITPSTSEPLPTIPCDCYEVQCTNGEGCTLDYIDCDGESIFSYPILGNTTINICGSIINEDQVDLIITNTGSPCELNGEQYECPDLLPTGDLPPTPSPTPTVTPTVTPTFTSTPTVTPTNPVQFLEGSICYDNKMSLHPASSSTVCTNIQGGVGSVNYYMSNCSYQTFLTGNPSGCMVYINDGVTLVGTGFLSDGCKFWEIVEGIVISTSAEICSGADECCITGTAPQ